MYQVALTPWPSMKSARAFPDPPCGEKSPTEPELYRLGKFSVETGMVCGVHSNIGGFRTRLLSDITLDGMVKRLRAHTGLEVNRISSPANPAAKRLVGLHSRQRLKAERCSIA